MRIHTLTGLLSSLFLHLTLASPSVAADLPLGFPETPRVKQRINTSWKFLLGEPDTKHFLPATDDSAWETISLPHTLKLTSIHLDGCQDDKRQLTFQRDVGWYRKTLTVTSDPHKKVFLEFEGAHQVTDLWVNGTHVGQHAVGGYTPFHFDISGFVSRGRDNQITLLVDNRARQDTPPDPGMFDYVKFSGLYRDVYLVETDPLHITFNWEHLDAGIFITTPVVDPVNRNAVIDFKTVVRNEYPEAKPATVMSRVIDRDGLVIMKLTQTRTILPGQDMVFKQIGAIEDDLHLWSTEDPYLYRVNSLVLVDGKPVDVLENRIGIRKFEHDPVRGFLLNHKPIELIGFNRHQHYGYIGDALPDSLHYKDMWQFKQLGLNTVRTAHYPQDDALLDACDELGILVYEEAPTWIAISQDEKWHENYDRSNRTMIRNHRNHPSVVIWGAGINHRGYVPDAVLACKQEDPTRLTASQSSRWTGWQTSGLTDLFANMMYGPGIWDRSEPLLAMEGRSGPQVVAEYKRDPLLTGIISWTAHAYYTFHPNNNPADRTRSGLMTVFREPRPSTLWYPSELTTAPFLHINGSWQPGTGSLEVYSNTEEVELLANGRSIGKQRPSDDRRFDGLDHPPFLFLIDEFEPGTLEARGLTGGRVLVSQTIHTPGKPERLKLVMDTAARSFTADGADILVGHAYVVDRNGTTITDSTATIRFSTTGPATVIGDDADIGANPIASPNGTAPVLIRAGTEPGEVTITATADGLQPASFTIATIPRNDDIIAATAAPIYDHESVSVDLGAPDQLVQFGWTSWNAQDARESRKSFPAFGGFEAILKPASADGRLHWLGEMNVIGKYGFVYGEGVIATGPQGLVLEFPRLPKGSYKLKTWHHAPSSNTDSMDPNREKLAQQDIPKLPFAGTLDIAVTDAGKNATLTTPVTAGKEMQFEPVATATLTFTSDGTRPVRIRFSDPDSKHGVWLNGFILSQWHAPE